MNDSFQSGFANAWAMFMTFVPKLLLAALIIVGGYYLGKLICRGLSRLLDRAGFNRMVEKGGVKRALDRSGWEAGQILSKTVFYFVMLLVLQLAFGVFGPNPVSAILMGIIAFLPKVFVAVIIVVLSAALASGAKQLIEVALSALSYGRLVARAAAGAILVVGVMAALNQLEIAPEIVNGLFYAMLATIVGILVVSVGGAGIIPMRQRWERGLARLEQEAPRIKEAAQTAPARAAAEVQNWTDQPDGGFKPIAQSRPLPRD